VSDRNKGLIEKYRVERTDGKSAPGQKHAGCFHFVLDIACDLYALPALAAYANACQREYGPLAADLMAIVAAKRDALRMPTPEQAEFEAAWRGQIHADIAFHDGYQSGLRDARAEAYFDLCTRCRSGEPIFAPTFPALGETGNTMWNHGPFALCGAHELRSRDAVRQHTQ